MFTNIKQGEGNFIEVAQDGNCPTIASLNMVDCTFHEVEMSVHQDQKWFDRTFTFSFGKSKFDNRPKQCSCADFDEFASVFDENRAPRKGMYQITAAMAGDGRRCKDNAMPRNWIAFDLDGALVNGECSPLSDDLFAETRLAFGQIGLGLTYETASSICGARRARFVLALDSAISREPAKRLCEFIQGLLPVGGYWDESVYKAEQPLYLPPIGVQVVRFGSEPICVDEALGMCPPPKVRQYTPRTPVLGEMASLLLGALNEMGMVISEERSGKSTIICPWSNEHTDGRPEAAYFAPSESNGGLGGFKCLHAHCANRNVGHLMKFVEDYAIAAEVRYAA